MARLDIENVSKVRPNGQAALTNVTCSVRDGELIAVVGPSGCGKSTLLRIIAGLDEVTSGEVKIGGMRVNDLPPQQRGIAMVFQNHALYPHMSVYQNLAFGLKVRHVPRNTIDARVRRTAEQLGLTSLLQRYPRELSGGQRQRTALGRAMLREPAVFLLDEPLSSLDLPLRTEMRRELAALHRSLGTTMIYVTHDQAEALSLGERVVVMSSGAVQQIDVPEAIYDRPINQFVAGFIGWPPMNFFSAQVLGDGEYDGARFEYGVRPERLHLRPEPADGLSITGTLERIESFGGEWQMELSCQGERLIARLPPEQTRAVGSEVRLWFRRSDVHVFERSTGKRTGSLIAATIRGAHDAWRR